MKFIHLSDLHLGKRVKNFPMIDDQRLILEQITDIIREEKPQAVVIAGDVYDKAVPSREAVELFDSLLVDLSDMGVEAFVISGNHDSPERISFASRLIDMSGIHMSPSFDGTMKCTTMTDEYGKVNFYMLPFVKPLIVKHFHNDADIEDYTDAVGCVISKAEINTAERNVLVCHQFITGAAACESEISVGGLDNVDAACLMDFDYAALGHLHTPQNIVKNKIRYAGTPLQYSFDEKSQKKSVTIVDMGEKGDVRVSERELILPHKFVEIRGTFDEIMEKYQHEMTDDYIKVVLTDENNVPDAFRRLQSVFEKLMLFQYDNKRTKERSKVESQTITKEIDEYDMVEKLYLLQNNNVLEKEQEKYLRELIDEVKEGML